MLISINSITNEAVMGILEILISAVLAGIFVYIGYEKEWKLAQQILAISVVIFVIKLIFFLLPYMGGG